jgi:plasmid stabilization system protein ParE
MPSQIHKTPQAAADLIDIVAFIAEDNPDAAERFLDGESVEAAACIQPQC